MTRHVRRFWGVLAITITAGACEQTPAMPGSMMDGGMANPPPVAEATTFASGTRYQARFLRAPATDPLLLSVHDRMRGLECLFTRDAAGLIRCTGPDTPDLPGADPGAVVEGQLQSVAFGDRFEQDGAAHARRRPLSAGRAQQLPAGGCPVERCLYAGRGDRR